MAKHAVFASSDIRATKAGHILNFLTEQDCDYGTVWAKGDQVEGSVNREIYKSKTCYNWRQSIRCWFCADSAKSKNQSRKC